ncbi:hypothetical protein E4U09_007989, partial [Claviceps aff. purpurea]
VRTIDPGEKLPFNPTKNNIASAGKELEQQRVTGQTGPEALTEQPDTTIGLSPTRQDPKVLTEPSDAIDSALPDSREVAISSSEVHQPTPPTRSSSSQTQQPTQPTRSSARLQQKKEAGKAQDWGILRRRDPDQHIN